MKFNLDSNQKNNNACFINKKYYELGERKNYSGKTNKIHKGVIISLNFVHKFI